MTGAYVATAWLAGIAAAATLPAPYSVLIAGLAAAALALRIAGIPPSRRLLFAIVALAALGLGGVLRYETGQPHPERSGMAQLNGGPAISVRGIVVAPPEDRGTSVRLRIEARALVNEDGSETPIDGKLLATVAPKPRFRYGDVLLLHGRPETAPVLEDFDYQDYLARQGIGSLMRFAAVERVGVNAGNPVKSRLFELRAYLTGVLARELAEPEAGLAQGMLLGERGAIGADLADDLNATGTSHLVVISGQNVAIIAALVIAGLAWLIGRRQAGVVALGTIVLFTLLAGADPPVVRGAIMGGAWTLATLLGRRSSAPVALLLAAALMTTYQPSIARDVSFQLSFAATAGIALIAGPLAERGRRALRTGDAPGLMTGVIETGSVTLAATLATLPIIAADFGRISLVALPANLLLVPLFPIILACSAATALLGGIAAPFAWLSLATMVRIARTLADFPYASVTVSGIGAAHVVAAYGLLGGFAWWVRRSPLAQMGKENEPDKSPARVIAPLGAGALMALLLLAALSAGEQGQAGVFEVRFMDVGQGDAALLRSPGGRTVLIDGGANGRLLAQRLGEALPPRDRSIDMVIATHSDADHVQGLTEVLRRFDVGALLVPERPSGTPMAALLAEARARGVPVRIGRAGQRFTFDGATLEVLSPTDGLAASDNNAALVTRFRFGSADVLFTADIEATAERQLIAAYPDAEVLKVAHHGSASSSIAAFLDAVAPQAAVVSVGAGNPFGHPTDAVMARLEAEAAHVFRTDEHGTVTLTTDGERIWLRSER